MTSKHYFPEVSDRTPNKELRDGENMTGNVKNGPEHGRSKERIGME